MGAWGHHEQVRKVNIGLVLIGNNQRVLIQFYSNTDLQNIKSFVFEKKKLFFTLKFNILYFYKISCISVHSWKLLFKCLLFYVHVYNV